MLESQKSDLLNILMSGDLSGARAKVAALSTEEQNTGFVQNFLGAVSLQEGRVQDAVEFFDNAVQLDRDYPAPLKNLALLYLQLNELELASSNIRKALSLVPDDPDALHTSGFVKLRAGKFHDAIIDLEMCLRGAPHNPKFLNTAGMAYFGVDEFLVAKRHFKKAADLSPDFEDAILNLARCERQLGNYSESDHVFSGLLERQPDNETALMGLAVNLLDNGNEAAALIHLERCVDNSPTHGNAHSLLAAIDRTEVNDRLFLHMQKIVESGKGESDSNLMHFRHALYKCYERSGDFRNAFINLKLANEHQARQRPSKNKPPYHTGQDRKLFESIADLEARFPDCEFRHDGTSNPAPIFIVGLPRSGTSLVERIVNNHSHVRALGELTYLQNAIETSGLLKAEAGVSAFSEVRQSYFAKTQQHRPNETYVIDKMPLNFRWIGVILRSFPEARIIHMHRQPQATCFSIFAHIFSGNLGFDNQLSDIASYYHLYSALMKRWQAEYPGKIFHLNYDDFVEHPRDMSMKLFDYLNLDWHPALIETENSDGAVATASRLQVRKSIYKGSSDFWQRYQEDIDQSVLDLAAFDPAER